MKPYKIWGKSRIQRKILFWTFLMPPFDNRVVKLWKVGHWRFSYDPYNMVHMIEPLSYGPFMGQIKWRSWLMLHILDILGFLHEKLERRTNLITGKLHVFNKRKTILTELIDIMDALHGDCFQVTNKDMIESEHSLTYLFVAYWQGFKARSSLNVTLFSDTHTLKIQYKYT